MIDAILEKRRAALAQTQVSNLVGAYLGAMVDERRPHMQSKRRVTR